MEFIRMLEAIRTGWLTAVMGLITRLGEEAVFIAAFLFVLWCVNKRSGFRLFGIFFINGFVNQILKLVFRVQRPWVRDPSLNTIESAKQAATGYSFPSGHTASAVSLYGSIAVMVKKRWVKIVCAFLILLVAFSRMYLGVHTPQDVLFSLLVSFLVLWGIETLYRKLEHTSMQEGAVFCCLPVLALIAVLVTELAAKARGAREEAWLMLGCTLAMLLAWWMDRRWIRFETKAKGWQQGLKFLIGITAVLALRVFLKPVLYALVPDDAVADGIRYFLLVFFAAGVYPVSFRLWKRNGKLKRSAE